MAISTKQNGRRLKSLVTITAGTPIPLASGPEPVKADRVQIQMRAGGAGQGLVYDDVPVGTAAADVATVAGPPTQLAPANADGITPGGEYLDTAEPNGFIDLREIWVDGSKDADTAMSNAHLKI